MAVAKTLGVSRSNLHDRLNGGTKPRRRYHKAQDDEQANATGSREPANAVAAGRAAGGAAPDLRLSPDHGGAEPCGSRARGLDPVNHKRVYRIMKINDLLLERSGQPGPERSHDGKVVMIRSNLRWCSDGLEFRCWNGETVRLAFIIDACDREVIAWTVVSGAGISGSDVRDMMLMAVERRFGTCRTPEPIEMLSDNGSPYTARETRNFARQLGLKPCFTPVKSPQLGGMAEAFVHTFKRDYVQVCLTSAPIGQI